MTITERVNTYPTKYEEGFTPTEINELLKEYPNIDMKKFNEATSYLTGVMIDGEFITFHSDVEFAIKRSVKKK
jgi:hypothetical protein